MGQAAHEAAAFAAELQRHVQALPAPTNTVQHHRALRNLDDLIRHFTSRLPAWAHVPRLMAAGAALAQRGEHEAAAQLCYGRLAALDLPSRADEPKLDESSRLALHVQAQCAQQRCRAAACATRDPQLLLASTAATLLDCLKHVRDACTQLLPHEALHVLVHDCTVCIHQVAEPLAAGARR